MLSLSRCLHDAARRLVCSFPSSFIYSTWQVSEITFEKHFKESVCG